MISLRIARRNRREDSSGFSLLEMAVAAALVTGMIVPALSVIRDAMAQSRDLHQRQLLANYAVRIIEDQVAWVAMNWVADANDPEIKTGDYSADGHSNIRYTMTTSDAPSAGGLDNQLMNVTVTVYDDADDDDTLDPTERQETYRTKVAKMNSYENEEL